MSGSRSGRIPGRPPRRRLRQDAGDLAAVDEHVVGPLDLGREVVSPRPPRPPRLRRRARAPRRRARTGAGAGRSRGWRCPRERSTRGPAARGRPFARRRRQRLPPRGSDDEQLGRLATLAVEVGSPGTAVEQRFDRLRGQRVGHRRDYTNLAVQPAAAPARPTEQQPPLWRSMRTGTSATWTSSPRHETATDGRSTSSSNGMPRVNRLAAQLMGDLEEARDAAQESLVKLCTRLRQFRGESQFATWLHRLVVNTCRDRLARQRIRQTEQLCWRTSLPARRAILPRCAARGQAPRAGGRARAPDAEPAPRGRPPGRVRDDLRGDLARGEHARRDGEVLRAPGAIRLRVRLEEAASG